MKKTVLIFFLCSLILRCTAQTYLDTICWVKVQDQNCMPYQNKYSQVDSLNTLFSNHRVHFYKKALPFAKNSELLKIYEIRCAGKIDSLIAELKNKYHSQFTSFSKFESESEKRMVYNPSDYMWYLTTLDTTAWLWHLKKTQCDKAWDLTKGSPNIKIAILDYNFDVTHPDLATKIYPTYDPYDSSTFDCSTGADGHGTAVASLAGAETDGGGQLASAGFNTMLIAYHTSGSRQVVLQKALHASNIMGANIIMSCAGAGALECDSDATTGERLIVKEILDNGTAIIWPAGNGSTGTHCPEGDTISSDWHPFYPFNPIYDNRIIIVSGTSKGDSLYYVNKTMHPPEETTWSYFPEVDLCAPGHDLMTAAVSNCDTSSWPYYGSSGGTSFATPIAAGIAALVLSVKPDLTPADLKTVLKSTTDPIADAANYPGMVGTGRINARKAVCYVYNNYPLSISNATIEGNNTFTRYQITITNSIFDTNSIVEIKTGDLTINSPFEVRTGGSLLITNYVCQ